MNVAVGSNLIFLRFGLGDAVRDRWVDGVLFFLSSLPVHYCMRTICLSWMKSEGNGCGKYLIKYHRVWIPVVLLFRRI